MFRKESNNRINTRESNFKRWNSRFSAGGANRTNIHDEIRKQHEQEPHGPRYPNSSIHPRKTKQSNFKQWNSRISLHENDSYERYANRYQPTTYSSTSRLPFDRYEYRSDTEDYDPNNFRDGKGRQMQKMGLFRNAKHSDIVRPNDEEQLLRRTEQTIRRLVRPERNRDDYRFIEPSNGIRDRVRHVVSGMNGSNDFRRVQSYNQMEYNGVARKRLFSPVRRYSNPRQNVLYDSGYEPHSITRQQFYDDQEIDDNFEDEFEQYYDEDNQRKRSKHTEEMYNPLDESEIVASPESPKKVEKQRKRVQKEKKQVAHSPLSGTSSYQPYCSPVPGKITKKPKEKPKARTNTPDASESPKPSNGQYIRDEDNDIKWPTTLKFLEDLDGEAAEIVNRFSSSVPTLSLRDDTELCYSKVAVNLLKQSIVTVNEKTCQEPEKSIRSAPKGSEVFDQLLNMTSYWGRDGCSTILAEGGEMPVDGEKSCQGMMNYNISEIQHPQNVMLADRTRLNINQSILKTAKTVNSKSQSNEKKQTIRFARPIFQSSVVSNDVIRSEEIIEDLSPIPKEPRIFNREQRKSNILNYSVDSDGPRQNDTDDYIARGASQLSFFNTPDIASSVFSQESHVDGISDESSSGSKAIKFIDDFMINVQKSIINPNKSISVDDNPFNFSILENESVTRPMMEPDETAQRIFENEFEEQNKRKKDNDKYLF